MFDGLLRSHGWMHRLVIARFANGRGTICRAGRQCSCALSPPTKSVPKGKGISNIWHYSDSREQQKVLNVWRFFFIIIFVEGLAFLQINLCFLLFRPGPVKQFRFGFIISEQNTSRKKELDIVRMDRVSSFSVYVDQLDTQRSCMIEFIHKMLPALQCFGPHRSIFRSVF
jgi:hypothetical protein